MNHRRPTQHWRKYRSGKHTLINRGIIYRTVLGKAIRDLPIYVWDGKSPETLHVSLWKGTPYEERLLKLIKRFPEILELQKKSGAEIIFKTGGNMEHSGYYDRERNIIWVDAEREQYPHTPFVITDTIFHELRHSLQPKLFGQPKLLDGPSPKESDTEKFVELDAKKFARQAIRRGLPTIQEEKAEKAFRKMIR